MKEIVILRSEEQLLRRLAIQRYLDGAAGLRGALLHRKQEGPQSHDGGLRCAPSSRGVLLSRDVVQRFVRVGRSLAGFKQRLDGKSGRLHRRTRAPTIDSGLLCSPPCLVVLLGASIEKSLDDL